jgi:hypothetical protein
VAIGQVLRPALLLIPDVTLNIIRLSKFYMSESLELLPAGKKKPLG